MRQSCRYCAHCFDGGEYRCSAMIDGKELYMSEDDIKKQNHCKEFALTYDIITGKEYKPRLRKPKNQSFEQLSFL